jgi:H+/Cl- antiporter ClcA
MTAKDRPRPHTHRAGDFAPNAPLLRLSLFAIAIGGLSTLGAQVLLAGIRLFTNIFYFASLSLVARSPSGTHLVLWALRIPILGGLIVGLLARYGSEQLRGHGIPEALEAILFGKSRMSPTVAVLKPLSSAIVIGSGGPFGAELPHDRRAVGIDGPGTTARDWGYGLTASCGYRQSQRPAEALAGALRGRSPP